MAYFYVSSVIGTRVAGGGTTKQTGSMATLGAANVYASIVLAIADGVVAGDFILCSDLHSHNNGGSAISYALPNTGLPVSVVSVDDTNIDQYKAGAKEETSSTVRFDGKSASVGLTYHTSASVACALSNASATYEDVTVQLTSSSDYIGGLGDGGFIKYTNSTIECADPTCGIRTNGGSTVEIFGGAFTATTTIDGLLSASAANGGGSVLISGCDLSPVDGFLLSNHGATQNADDNLVMVIDRCKLNASVGFIEETLTNLGVSILVTNSSSSSAASEYQYYYQDYFGSIEDDTATFRNESTAFDGGTKVSFAAISNANVSIGSPLSFSAHRRFAALSSASTDTIRIYFTSDTALTDADVWAELSYPDGTNKQTYNSVSNRVVDILAAGTAHTTDGVSTYTLGKTNKYYMDLDTSVDAGADSVPSITIYIGLASTTIYFDTTVDVVA